LCDLGVKALSPAAPLGQVDPAVGRELGVVLPHFLGQAGVHGQHVHVGHAAPVVLADPEVAHRRLTAPA